MALPPTTGAPLNLYVPPFNYGVNPGDDTYDIPENDNAETINSFAATVVLYNPTVSQTVAQPGSTFLNLNKVLAYDGAVRFGAAANAWDSALSRSGAGAFTLDSNTIGNAAATLKLNVLNAVTGLQVNSAAPLHHILVGDGTHYVDSATLPTGIAFYQTVQAAGTSRPQEPRLNFLARMTAVNNGGNTSTDVDLATTGVTPGSYTLGNFTVDAYGRITAAASGFNATRTNKTGTYTAGVTYTNGAKAVYEEVTMSVSPAGGSGDDWLLASTINGVPGPSATLTNTTYGFQSVGFWVPAGGTFSVALTHPNGSNVATQIISTWTEVTF